MPADTALAMVYLGKDDNSSNKDSDGSDDDLEIIALSGSSNRPAQRTLFLDPVPPTNGGFVLPSGRSRCAAKGLREESRNRPEDGHAKHPEGKLDSG